MKTNEVYRVGADPKALLAPTAGHPTFSREDAFGCIGVLIINAMVWAPYVFFVYILSASALTGKSVGELLTPPPDPGAPTPPARMIP